MEHYNTGYTKSLTNIERHITRVVPIGDTALGVPFPIRIQTMTTTDTNDIEATLAQCRRIIEAGGEYVRITAQGVREAENLKLIKDALLKEGYTTPLIADIHYNPKAALVAAEHIEKVRINPGNYTESITKTHYTEEEYKEELKNIRSKLKPLLEVCKEHDTAIRIGVNHGSLSSRIMSKYGDTPMGMAMSMMEFLHICSEEGFFNIVCSIKASNTRVMVYATRLLIKLMQEEDLKFPIHLGVTEAGDSAEGRVKSAVGIGALLADGIGDTVRVSLTEEPECEIPVCKLLVDYDQEKNADDEVFDEISEFRDSPFDYNRRESKIIAGIGGTQVPKVFSYTDAETVNGQIPDFIINEKFVLDKENNTKYSPLDKDEYLSTGVFDMPVFLHLDDDDLDDKILEKLQQQDNTVIIFKSTKLNFTSAVRVFFSRLKAANITSPVILERHYNESELDALQVKSGFDFGSVFIDGLGDGILLNNEAVEAETVLDTAFIILQSARARFSKTEYISCPSCGRTLYNIQETVKEIKARTAHLAGVKIGIMGCIVNGPGEMADADYGFVGAGKGKINLYKQRNVIKKNIPREQALEELIELIKENGDWVEKK